MSAQGGDESEPKNDRGRNGASLLTTTALSAVGFYLLIELVLPYVSMWLTGAPSPLPVPSALALIYALVFVTGVLVYVTSSDERMEEIVRPIASFLAHRAEGPSDRTPQTLARRAVLGALPLLVGFGIWRLGAPGVGSPTTIRIQHPTMPGKYEGLVNPWREEASEAVLREGTALYQTNCRPCHGVAAGGDGPMARFFRLQPADFRDPGYIATVVEPYAFWRVSEGGPGLPPVATPWDSAMPIWKNDLSEEERWKVLLAEYATAGVEPRKPEKLE